MAIIKKSPLRESESLKYSGFSLAELLPGKEKKKIFLPLYGDSKAVSLPARDAKYVSFCWDLRGGFPGVFSNR